MINPPRWSAQEFDADCQRAISIFRRERLQEPLETYVAAFDDYRVIFAELLESTADLGRLRAAGLRILTDDRLLQAFRYLTGPPISRDDLMTVAEVVSLNKAQLERQPQVVEKIVDTALTALDRRRFPWVGENREPTKEETAAALVASAALLATQRVGTSRRSEGKKAQELHVEDVLLQAGFAKVPTRPIPALPLAPECGQFCGESLLGTRKADFVLRLWDHRILAVECKVSNSALNSVKRVNNDAAAKAEVWRRDFGETQIVPAAVISGVFRAKKLEEAQNRGLTIFWAHKLETMIDWIAQTRP
jgi:hypothetical protein